MGAVRAPHRGPLTRQDRTPECHLDLTNLMHASSRSAPVSARHTAAPRILEALLEHAQQHSTELSAHTYLCVHNDAAWHTPFGSHQAIVNLRAISRATKHLGHQLTEGAGAVVVSYWHDSRLDVRHRLWSQALAIADRPTINPTAQRQMRCLFGLWTSTWPFLQSLIEACTLCTSVSLSPRSFRSGEYRKSFVVLF